MGKSLKERMEFIKLFWDWCGEKDEANKKTQYNEGCIRDPRYSNQTFHLFMFIDSKEVVFDILSGDFSRSECVDHLESLIDKDLKKEFCKTL